MPSAAPSASKRASAAPAGSSNSCANRPEIPMPLAIRAERGRYSTNGPRRSSAGFLPTTCTYRSRGSSSR